MSCIDNLNLKYKKNCYKKKKTLVISALCFPPVLIGPAVLMGNLFMYFPKKSFHILMGRLDHIWMPIDGQSKLPANYTFTRFPITMSGVNWIYFIRFLLRDIIALIEITWKGMKIIRRERVENIFVTRDHYVELAALFIHWLTGKKIAIWLPDLYYVPDSSREGWTKSMDRLMEPFMLKSMDMVFVTGEPTRDYYRKKYGIDTVLLPHTVDIGKYNKMSRRIKKNNSVTKIIFTGTLGDAQPSGILDLLTIAREFPELNIKLNVITNTSPDQAKTMGIKGENVTVSRAKRSEIPGLQVSADILFLPLAFKEHGYHHFTIVRTASPSKLPEYLAAGRPIIVYAPSDSYYAKYAKKEGFGLVVDKPDLNLLREAIIELKNNRSLCERLVKNARRVAIEYHDAEKLSSKLQYFLNK